MESKLFKGATVYENGSIYSRLGKELIGDINSKGYRRVIINSKKYLVHRLVAILFVPNPQNKPQVNHKDEDKLNNHKDNLEWMTNKENSMYSYLNRENKKPNARLSEHDVIEIRKLKDIDVKVSVIAGMFTVDVSTIYNILKGKSWKT